MLTLARNDGPAARKGTWQPVAESSRHIFKARICCPGCGYDCTLRGTHDVADDGAVSPSLVCPNDGCGFHEFVKLEGWP